METKWVNSMSDLFGLSEGHLVGHQKVVGNMALSLIKQKIKKCGSNVFYEAFLCKLCPFPSCPHSPSSTPQTAPSDTCRHCLPMILKRKSSNLNKGNPSCFHTMLSPFPDYFIKWSSQWFFPPIGFWSSIPVCVCARARVPHIDKQFSDPSWLSYNLNQFWHYLYQIL